MTQIKSEIRINASKEKVWEVLGDFGGVSKWAPTVAKSFSTTTATEGVGCERKCEIPGFGNVSERITEWDEGTRIKYAVDGLGPIKSAASEFSIRREGEDTLATMTVNFQMKFGLIGALMERLMVRRKISKQAQITLAGLKHHVETGEIVTLKVYENFTKLSKAA